MKAILGIVCLLTLGVCVEVGLNGDLSNVREQFAEYVKKYSKVYSGSEEYEQRFKNFMANLAIIEKTNVLNGKVRLGINKFSDMPKAEFSEKMLAKKISAVAAGKSCLSNGVTSPQLDVSALPTSFDWRTKNVVTPVKDQGQCGSCWAFSTIGNIESQWAIKGHKLTSFSEQLLVDCSHGCTNEPPYGNVCNQGCDGGWQWNAFGDVVSWGGVETESQYPYTAEDGTCQLNKKLLQAKISDYTCLTNSTSKGANEDYMAAFLIANGPLSIAMDATPLQSYWSGIIDPNSWWDPLETCSQTELDHALLLVGFGVEDSEIWGKTPFWIIKNSWGTDWGETGYFRIIRGGGACGLNTAVSTSVML